MDLTSFTNKKETKEEVILDNKEVKIVKRGEKISFTLKTKNALKKYEDYLFFSPTNSLVTSDEKKAQEFFKESIEAGVEGLMIKSLKAPYKPGLRTGSMVKLKEAKEDIDVVILAAEYGTGKRAGYYSSFYVGVRNDDHENEEDKFLNVGKVSSGVKELGDEGASLKRLTELLEPLKIREDKGVVYLKPEIVIQIRYQEIQKSTAYNSGYALRFPRIISLRDDKDTEEINSIEDIDGYL